MIFEYRNAPMHYVDGVAAYKYGEWPGRTSCKFSPTRKIIRPITDGIIFNDNEPPLVSKKKVYLPKPSEEMVFRPCVKMVKLETDKPQKVEGLKIIKPTPKAENIVRPKRTEYFKYQQDHIKELMKKNDEGDNKLIIKNELKQLSRIAFSKRVMEALPNSKLMTFSLLKDLESFNSSRSINPKLKSLNKKSEFIGPVSAWQKKEQEKMNVIKNEQDNLKKDIHYVKTLNDWDSTFLPKIK